MTLAAFLALAPQCAPAVHPNTLAAVLQTESRFHLFAVAVNENGRSVSSRRLASKAEAVAHVESLLARGVTNIDMGPAQINYRAGHLQRLGLPISAAFEPCAALGVSADVLVRCWNSAPAQDEQARLDAMLSCYNTGRHRITNDYVVKVRMGFENQIVPSLRARDGSAPEAPPPRPVEPSDAAQPACVPPEWDAWARCPEPVAPNQPPPAPPEEPVRLRGIAMGNPSE